jgi:RHS repeat-associated protein
MRDRYGNTVTFSRDPATGNLLKITSPNNRSISFAYDSSSRITTATDNSGRQYTYTYDSGGRLATVTDPMSGVTQYAYDYNNEMLTIVDPRGNTYLTNQYDTNGRVMQQTMADGGIWQYSYTQDINGNIVQTDITNPRGFIDRVTFNTTGYFSGGQVLSYAFAQGTAQQQTKSWNRTTSQTLLPSMTDVQGRNTTFSYDPQGNVTNTSFQPGPSVLQANATFDTSFSRILSYSNSFGANVSLSYNGNQTTVTNALGITTTINQNSSGQITSLSDSAGNSRQYSYSSGLPMSVTDALSQVSSSVYDSLGRPVQIIDSQGHTIRIDYDLLGRVVKRTDANGAAVSYTYDANGNVLTVKDTLNNTTTFTYDAMNQVTKIVDPSNRSIAYEYDKLGNRTKRTDRKGQITQYSYDSRNRISVVTYADTSTLTYTYDANGNLTQLVDSLSGTITRTYDSLNNVLTESSTNGTVTYTYDSMGRKSTMTAGNQTAVNYAYDSFDRISQITQGSSALVLAYDSTGRVATATLPNGVIKTFGYDAVSRVNSISFSRSGVSMGNLTYQRDSRGKIVATAGSLARTSLPAALSSASYDGSNQVLSFGNALPTYDQNGNLTNDGTYTFNWDARDHLASISTGAQTTATFQYDAFGRRVGKTVGGQSTQFLYDEDAVVQELSGGTPIVNLFAAGADATFMRSDSSGVSTLLSDPLGSVMSLTDTLGNQLGQYTYEPFGKATSSGTTGTNEFQFTGKENDGIGMYFFRARYYNPVFQRFISQDPAGPLGNLYAYADNDPIGESDPTGKESCPECEVGVYARSIGLTIGVAVHSFFDLTDREGNQHVIQVHGTWEDSWLNQLELAEACAGSGPGCVAVPALPAWGHAVAEDSARMNGWIRYGNTGGAGAQRIGGVPQQGGRSREACDTADCVIGAVNAFNSFNRAYIPAPVWVGVNSNTFVHWAALRCSVPITRVPGNAAGWDNW